MDTYVMNELQQLYDKLGTRINQLEQRVEQQRKEIELLRLSNNNPSVDTSIEHRLSLVETTNSNQDANILSLSNAVNSIISSGSTDLTALQQQLNTLSDIGT